MLPLPMAALVSLTITFKLEKNLDYIQAVIGQALENCSTGCSWPSMPIIGALWTQKVRRWREFIVFSCTLSSFTRDKDAVAQLIRSCFSSFFGHHGGSPNLTSHRGVIGLLGDSFSDKDSSLSIAPGFLYLRTCRTFHDTHFVSNTILRLVIEWAHNLAARCSSSGPSRLKSGQTSLADAAAGVREVATLGVSLMCIAGGGQMVQILYEETLPAALMSVRDGENVETSGPATVLEGYAMAYLLVLSGACVWGAGKTSPAFTSAFSSRRARAISVHMEFVAGVIDDNVALGCNPATWKAYVSCFVGLLVAFVPEWVPEVRKETLRKLANGLRGWHECELALELLERGGPEALTAVVESLL